LEADAQSNPSKDIYDLIAKRKAARDKIDVTQEEVVEHFIKKSNKCNTRFFELADGVFAMSLEWPMFRDVKPGDKYKPYYIAETPVALKEMHDKGLTEAEGIRMNILREDQDIKSAFEQGRLYQPLEIKMVWN